jgi:hypothetical protein
VIGVAAAQAGVVAVDLDRLYRGYTPALDDRLLADQTTVDASGNPVAAEVLAISDEPFDWLAEMTP